MKLLKSIETQSSAKPGRRNQLFSRWRESLPLMGTPESALSDPIAQVFIDYGLQKGTDVARLRQLRRERALADGVSPERVEALLRGIDQAFPAHPWVTGVEAREQNDGGSPAQRKPRS